MSILLNSGDLIFEHEIRKHNQSIVLASAFSYERKDTVYQVLIFRFNP